MGRKRRAQPNERFLKTRNWIRPSATFHPRQHQSITASLRSLEKGMRRPYHKKKLALVLSNERHFALEQAARGVKVIYILAEKSFGDGLLQAQEKHT